MHTGSSFLKTQFFSLLVEGDSREKVLEFMKIFEIRLVTTYFMLWYRTMPFFDFKESMHDAVAEFLSDADEKTHRRLSVYVSKFNAKSVPGIIDTMVLDDDTTGKINFLLESLNMGAIELRRFLRTVANGLGIPCPRTPMAVLDEEDEES